LDLYHDGTRLQVILNASTFQTPKDFTTRLLSLQRGDIVQVTGLISRSKSGELSIRANDIHTLVPCLRNIPDIHAPEMTEEHRTRWRHLDLLARPDSINVFKRRSVIIRNLRDFMFAHDFIEVETPVLSSKAGGAAAKPFKTQLEALDIPLSLRIAPELFLKQLIIGGFDRVFELGKVFRNEGIDATHNPEFTTLEMYQSFASMNDMILLAEDLLSYLANSITNDSSINYQGNRISFEGPFQRIQIVPTLEEILKVRFDFDDAIGTLKMCRELLISHDIKYDASNKTLSYVFDKLIGHFLEPKCVQPTFLVNHPMFMSPLARPHPTHSHLSARFELFIAGRELMNGYSELNDPSLQRQNFSQQMTEREAGHFEAHLPDEDFVAALEAGMPPTAGCGIGIDRLVMLFTDKRHIRDVIFFPLNRPLH
jgi:lysyl-tRNA synthetase class 2